MNRKIIWFKNVTIQDIPQIGTKNALLGEAYRHLGPKGINIPNGFAITSNMFNQHLHENKIIPKILSLHENLDFSNTEELELRSLEMQQMILESQFNSEIENLILKAYDELKNESMSPEIAIKSSSADYSLPGTSILGIQNEEDLLDGVMKCFSFFFSPREMIFRETQGINHFKHGISVGVQRMINTSNTCCGDAYSRDIFKKFDNSIVVTGTYGIKLDLLEKGLIKPDEWVIFEKRLNPNLTPIIKKELGKKHFSYSGGFPLELKKLSQKQIDSFCLPDEYVLKIARDTKAIERFFSSTFKKEIIIEVEWTLDQESNIHIVRISPSNSSIPQKLSCMKVFTLKQGEYDDNKILATGFKIGTEIINGRICKMESPVDTNFEKHSIILAESVDRSWHDVLKESVGLITDIGNKSSLVSRMCREGNLNCIIGTKYGTEKIKDKQLVTMDNSTFSEEGIIFDSHLQYHMKEYSCRLELPKMKTKLMIELLDFAKSFDVHHVPNDGIGCLTFDSVYKSLGFDHYMSHGLMEQNVVELFNEEVLELSKGFGSLETYIFEKVAESIAYGCTPFYPKFSIVKLSNVQNEEILQFEVSVLKRVKDIIGFSNIMIQIPDDLQPDECEKLMKKIRNFGLLKEHGWKFLIDVPIPSNSIDFEKKFDHVNGFMINIEWLTKLFCDNLDVEQVNISEFIATQSNTILPFLERLITRAHQNPLMGILICH
eukprot:gene33-4284_t